MRSKGTPILSLKPEKKEPSDIEKLSRDLLKKLDQIHRKQRPGQLQLDARIASYELAGRMQLSASEALDTNSETLYTREAYGIGEKETDAFGRQCLMSRRLVERGVRFVQVHPVGQQWDNHKNIGSSLPSICRKTDKPVAGFAGRSETTWIDGRSHCGLGWWNLGRLPIAQVQPGTDPQKAGRDHGPAGFSVWFAGAGIKGGTVHGSTDEIGWRAVENRVSINDWHATILHLLGLHNEELFFEADGFNKRLTGVEKVRVVREILA